MKFLIQLTILFISIYCGESCQPEWYNRCKVHSECCSNYCDKPEYWQFGVCKSSELKCLKSRESGCDKTKCCDGSKCYNGPDSTWSRGICVDNDLMNTINGILKTDQEKYENEEDDYLQFVKNYLLDQNELRFESNKIRCRELDPKGSYFYRYNEEYSFRICDACKELPIRKVNAIKIDENPIDTINSNTTDRCFAECIGNDMCVACSFNHDQNQCLLFDTVDGKFQDVNDWQTLVIPQPVDVLRDYIYSRNTMIKCNDNATKIQAANSMLDCFAFCETTNCSIVEFSSNACKIIADDKNCNTTSFKYGHTTLFYKDYFDDDDISWRFNISSDELLDYIEDNGSANTTDVAEVSTKIGIVSSTKLLRELKSLQNGEYFTKCQETCLNLTTCIGIRFNPNNYDCKMIDVMNMESLFTKSLYVNYTAVQLIHPHRDSIIYGFQTQLIAKYSYINYKTKKEQTSIVNCIKECKSHDECRDILYNYADRTCLTNDDLIGANRESIKKTDKWIMLSKNRPRFNTPEFKFTLIGRNKRLSIEHNEFISLEKTFPGNVSNGLSKCLTLCLEHDNNTDTCNLAQVERSNNSIKCKLYNIDLFNRTINSDDILFSNLYLVTLNKNFDQNDLNQMPIMSEEDAYDCEIDKESILLDMLYLTSINGSTDVHRRSKRGFWDSVGSFFKGVGEAIVDTGKKVVDTVVGGAKAVGKLVTGDAKGALEEVKNTPIYKEGENLIENVKTVGDGIVHGDLKKIGEGLLGVATNDLLSFIPGQKAIGIGAKAIKTGIKGTIKGAKNAVKGVKKTFKKGAKKDAKHAKDNIVEKNFKKKDHDTKKKKDKDKKKEQCPVKNRKTKRATGKKRKRGDCDDEETCKKPKFQRGSGKKIIRSSLTPCASSKFREFCFYLCNAGFSEKPEHLVCEAKGRWSADADCEAQTCERENILHKYFILVKSSTVLSVLDKKRGNKEVPLYLVLFDDKKKLPIYSVAYYKFSLVSAKFTKRTNNFRPHPCTALINKQAYNKDYSTHNPHKFERGHLTPADLFRWNDKTRNSGNLLINVAPQAAQFNKGSWKTLESTIQCASAKGIYAIVATGVAGTSQYVIGQNRDIQVPKYFWKLVCYRERKSLRTYVALFIGENEPREETDAVERFTLTPRSQKDLDQFDPSILTFHNPWRGVPKIQESFFRSVKYPTVFECTSSPFLPDEQVQRWKKSFKIFGNKNKRSTDEESFCSRSEIEAILSDKLLNEDDADNEIENEDEEENESENGSIEEDDFDGNSNVPSSSCDKKIVGYYTSWSKTQISTSLLSKFTHIIFAFFEMKSDGTVGIGNPDHSSAQTLSDNEVTQQALSNLKSLMRKKSNIPGLKVTFAVGGWENSQYFSSMAADPTLKQNFIASVVKTIDEYGFDGIDIDWEYPVTGGAKEGLLQDKENYVSLLRDLRGVFESKSPGQYLISFASAAGEDALKNGYDLPELLNYADWVNVMSYDFFGPWDSKWGAYTGPPAPLYHNVPKGYSGKFNVNWAIKQYVCDLQSPNQVVMGIPLYGRYWHNVPDKQGDHAMYRMANAVNGKFSGGFASWRDISANWLKDSNFKHHFDDKVKCPYAFNSNGTYIGYESPESVRFKIEFAIKSNLGGLMVWAIDQDDDEQTMITQISQANLCTNDESINFKCIPIKERRWWTLTDGEDMGGLCGKSAPLFRGFYPVCDPDDLGYSCCGSYGYCGSGDQYCDCPTCVNYADDPNKILAEPTKPTTNKISWYFSNAPDGQRGRCGRGVPKLNNEFATCNPDDPNAYCCSNGGYCGQGEASCQCNGCINFKDKPNYKYPPKTWWEWGDGPDKSGKCGANAPKLADGSEPGCDADSDKYYCCSSHGNCGSGNDFCECSGCKNYKH